MIDDSHTTDTHLGGRNIYTARDWKRGMDEAWRIEERAAARTLWEHAPHAHHCDGYEVLAWPCPTAAKVLDKLLGGDQRTPTISLTSWMLDNLSEEVIGANVRSELAEHIREALAHAWEEGARDGSRGLLPATERARRNPYAPELCACGWSNEEHDPAEHRPERCDICHGEGGWAGHHGVYEPCPKCGGAA